MDSGINCGLCQRGERYSLEMICGLPQLEKLRSALAMILILIWGEERKLVLVLWVPCFTCNSASKEAGLLHPPDLTDCQPSNLLNSQPSHQSHSPAPKHQTSQDVMIPQQQDYPSYVQSKGKWYIYSKSHTPVPVTHSHFSCQNSKSIHLPGEAGGQAASSLAPCRRGRLLNSLPLVFFNP